MSIAADKDWFSDGENDSTSVTTSKHIMKRGFLQKRGNIVRNWKTRFFVLMGHSLSYYISSDDLNSTARGVLDIRNVDFIDVADFANMSFCFALRMKTPDTRVYALSASDENDMDSWISAIKMVMKVHDGTERWARPPAKSVGRNKLARIENHIGKVFQGLVWPYGEESSGDMLADAMTGTANIVPNDEDELIEGYYLIERFSPLHSSHWVRYLLVSTSKLAIVDPSRPSTLVSFRTSDLEKVILEKSNSCIMRLMFDQADWYIHTVHPCIRIELIKSLQAAYSQCKGEKLGVWKEHVFGEPSRTASLQSDPFPECMMPVLEVVEAAGYSRKDVFNGDIDLLKFVEYINTVLPFDLQGSEPYAGRSKFLIDFRLDDSDACFGGLKSMTSQVVVHKTIEQVIADLLANIGRRIASPIPRRQYALLMPNGMQLEASKTLGEYGLGVVLHSWRLTLVAMGDEDEMSAVGVASSLVDSILDVCMQNSQKNLYDMCGDIINACVDETCARCGDADTVAKALRQMSQVNRNKVLDLVDVLSNGDVMEETPEDELTQKKGRRARSIVGYIPNATITMLSSILGEKHVSQ